MRLASGEFAKLAADKLLYEQDGFKLRETPKGRPYIDGNGAVAVLPFRRNSSKPFLTVLEPIEVQGKGLKQNCIFGGISGHGDAESAAVGELHEEGGIEVSKKDLISLGKAQFSKSLAGFIDLFAVDVTGKDREKPEGDGSEDEEKLKPKWLSREELVKSTCGIAGAMLARLDAHLEREGETKIAVFDPRRSALIQEAVLKLAAAKTKQQLTAAPAPGSRQALLEDPRLRTIADAKERDSDMPVIRQPPAGGKIQTFGPRTDVPILAPGLLAGAERREQLRAMREGIPDPLKGVSVKRPSVAASPGKITPRIDFGRQYTPPSAGKITPRIDFGRQYTPPSAGKITPRIDFGGGYTGSKAPASAPAIERRPARRRPVQPISAAPHQAPTPPQPGMLENFENRLRGLADAGANKITLPGELLDNFYRPNNNRGRVEGDYPNILDSQARYQESRPELATLPQSELIMRYHTDRLKVFDKLDDRQYREDIGAANPNAGPAALDRWVAEYRAERGRNEKKDLSHISGPLPPSREW